MARVNLALPLVLLLAAPAAADTIVFDFEDGPGPLFTVFNDGGLWSIDEDGPRLRINKPTDDLSILPGETRAGVASTFPLVGDFTVTVDWHLYDFPEDLSHSETYNHIVLAVFEEELTFSGNNYLTLRFRQASSQEIEAWHLPPGSIEGRQPAPSAIMTDGRFRISRSGSQISSFWAPLGNESFQLFGSTSNSSVAPMHVRLFAGQARTCTCEPTRANTSLDISFDNLIVVSETLPTSSEGSTWSRIKRTEWALDWLN